MVEEISPKHAVASGIGPGWQHELIEEEDL
jgi:hypothetical protein